MTAVNMEGLLADIERRERKARTVGALLILIPMTVGLAILAYTGVQMRTLQSLLKTKADLSRQITKASQALEQKKSELALANKAVGQSDRAPETAANAPAQIIPRIYIQIRSDSQRASAEQVANTLRAKGWVVPGIEQRDEAPNRTQVRYYRSSERSDAEKIVQILGEIGIQAVSTMVPGYENSHNVRPGHYEIWFNSTFSGPQEEQLGFVNSDQSGVVTYRGKDGESVEVKVHYSGEQATVTYNLDGMETKLSGESFSFVLNKSRHNPSKLVLKVGFDSRAASYNVNIETSGGQTFATNLRPSGGLGRADSFIFYIL